jgi:putative flippase GtrA
MSLLNFLDVIILSIIKIPVIRDWKWAASFLRFCAVGIVNTSIDFTVYFSLTRGMHFFLTHFLIANFLAFLCANVFSYWANKHWTFQNKSTQYFFQYSKFLITSLFALGAIQTTLYICVHLFDWWDLFAKIIALGVSLIINFVGARFWAFRS